MVVAALVIAGLLIAAGGFAVARADWAAVPTGRRTTQERLWVILPAAFLIVLVALAAFEGLR